MRKNSVVSIETEEDSVAGTPRDLIQRLREFSLFSTASPEFLETIASKLVPQMYPAQSFVITEGEEARAMYWIVRGTVAIVSRDGEAVHAELGPGAFFGEIGILFDCPRTASVQAREKCLVAVLTAGALNEVLPQHPDMERAIRDEAQERLAVLEKTKLSVGVRGVLGEMPLFETMPREMLHRLALLVVVQSYGPFEIIFKQDTVGKDIYFIIDGQVEVIEEKSNTVIARLGKGSYFGEMAFLSLAEKRTASVRSITEVDCLVVTEQTLDKLCRDYPEFQIHIRETANNRIDKNQQLRFGSISTTSSDTNEEKTKPLDHDPFQIKKPSETDDEVQQQASKGVELFSKSWNTTGSFGSASIILKPPSQETAPDDPVSEESDLSAPSTPSISHRIMLDQASEGVVDETGSGGYMVTDPPTSDGRFNNVVVKRHGSLLLHPRAKRVRQTARRRSSLLTIGPFPDMIQVKIFQYLDLKTLMRIQRVCRHWQQMLQTSQHLLKVLDLKPYNTTINDNTILLITNFAGLRPKVVDISNCFHLTDEGFSFLVNGIGLAKINVFRMKSVWEVSGMAIMDLTVPSIGADLEEIDLSNCRKVGDSTLSRLIGWVVPDDGQVVGCAKLKRISLSYCKHITDRSLYHMAMFASDRLEALDLTRCTTITDHGFSFWTLRSFTALRELCLADCTFLTDKSIMAIASSAKQLTHLNLSFCCALTDLSVEVLALGCQNLQYLNLQYCGSAVSDMSLSTVALHLTRLENLVVRGCVRVTRRGAETVVVVAGAHSLKNLDISQCRNVLGKIDGSLGVNGNKNGNGVAIKQ